MTQDRRITDKLPARPLDWGNTETLAGQTWNAPVAAASPSPAQSSEAVPRPTDDHLWDETLRNRDQYHEWADKLAEAISKHFDAYIGEHSNTNCPWAEALEAIESATPTATSSEAAPTDRDAVLEEAAKAIEHYSLAEQLIRASMASPVMAGVGFTRAAAEAIRALKDKASSEAAAPDLSGLLYDLMRPYGVFDVAMHHCHVDNVSDFRELFDKARRAHAAISKSPTSLAGSGEKGESK